VSEVWLIVLPTDSLAIPAEDRRNAAFALLCTLRPGAQDPELHVSETPVYFDCGSNFESVFCPFCAAEIKHQWWSEQMDKWWSGDRRNLAVVTPCCRRATGLNDLDYVWPQGFACVAFELMRPEGDLEPSEREQVEAVLGVPIRTIWRHI
jgi:hypothetical protein